MTAIPTYRRASTKTSAIVFAVGAALVAPTLVRPQAHGPVLCPLRRLTGMWCPTCGMTRAAGWMAHLDFGEAARIHPLAPVLLLECLVVATVAAVRRRRHPNGPLWSARWVAVGRAALVVNALLFLVVWLIRVQIGSFDDLG